MQHQRSKPALEFEFFSPGFKATPSPHDHVELVFHNLNSKWWLHIFPLVLTQKLKSRCRSKNNTIPNATRSTKVENNFCLSKLKKLVQFRYLVGHKIGLLKKIIKQNLIKMKTKYGVKRER